MALTDRQAADMGANSAVAKAHQTMSRNMQANRGNMAMAFRKGLNEAVPELSARLIELYSELPDASDEKKEPELAAEVTRQVTSFIKSSLAGQRGSHVATAAREAANAASRAEMGIRNSFKLAVHARSKTLNGTPSPPARRKQDKFEILDSPREFPTDFIRSVGALGVSVIFVDLDDFKKLNNQFTEPVIDRTLLRELMGLLRALVEGRGFAYAEGGDEFVITLPNTNTALAEAFTIVLLERIRNATFDVDGHQTKVTASAGIASTMNTGEGQVCREAASAAKRDAKNGRDRHVVSDMRT